jgi:thymidylate synthase
MSCDTFLGIPYNIVSYATLALILEKITGYKALAIQGDLKKVHLYDNSLDAVKEQLSRNVDKYDKCELLFKDEFHYITDKELVGEVSLDKIISKMEPDWFLLGNYESYPAINVEMLSRNN